MKMALRSWLRSLTNTVVRAILDRVPDDVRHDIFLYEFSVWLREDPKTAFEMILEKSASSPIPVAQYDRLVIRGCERLNAASISDACVAAFEVASGGKVHYSQEGEDIILLRLFEGRRDGFYVDVGAHHPTRFSNTYALYRMGWRGINIDATPGSMQSFSELRPQDINLEFAISDRRGPLSMNVFGEGALNTFDPVLAGSYSAAGYKLRESVSMPTHSLVDVLDRCLPKGQHIDLLTVDVEGEDMGVLRSNDWKKYCPDIVVVETLDTSLACVDSHPAVVFLAERGFSPLSRLYNSVILKKH